jgi:hypothetical protein
VWLEKDQCESDKGRIRSGDQSSSVTRDFEKCISSRKAARNANASGGLQGVRSVRPFDSGVRGASLMRRLK